MTLRTTTTAALLLLAAFSVGACRNTYNGAKTDTKNAVDSTGHAMEKAGKKLESDAGN